MPDIDQSTGLPRELSIGEVLNDIRLAPTMVSEFIRSLAYDHIGGPHDDMGRALLQQANKVADPATYGNADKAPVNPQVNWGAAQAQSGLPPSGGITQPSWMADARAAGWNDPNTDASPAPDIASPPPEPAWMAQARAAGWTGKSPTNTSDPASRDVGFNVKQANPPPPGSPSAAPEKSL